MSVLYFDCSMGAAGDMIVASLLQLIPDPYDFIRDFNALHIEQFGKGTISLSATPATRCGITGLKADMLLTSAHGQACEELPDCEVSCCAHEHHHEHKHHHDCDHHHDHEHHHDCDHHEHDCGHHHDHEHHEHDCGHHHDHEHHEHAHSHHHGMTLSDIGHILQNIDISDSVRQHVMAIFDSLAQAESKAHGCTVEQIHFHEVGQLDAVADILAACLLIDRLSPEKIFASPICIGSGFVKCAHGILPVPAPATAELLRDIPVYAGTHACEMCTPTGAAILRHFVHEFRTLPEMSIERTGYGMGHREFPDSPNMLRSFLGALHTAKSAENLAELVVNVDDMTGEHLGFALEELMSAGALDAWAEPIFMKKSRPAYKLSCLVHHSDTDKFIQLMLRHSSSFGVRIFSCDRYALPRKLHEVDTPFGKLHQKSSTSPEFPRSKWEYEELAQIAREKGLTLQDILNTIK